MSMLTGKRTRSLVRELVCLGAMFVLVGCHHRQQLPHLPAVVLTPDVPPPVPTSDPMTSPPPDSVETPSQVKVTEAKPKRPPKKPTTKSVAPETAPPVEIAAAPPAEPSPIGELSTGGDAIPQKQQETVDLIEASQRRLEALSKTASSQQQSQIRKISHFLLQAKQALSTGDVEGAKTLAFKAKLLLDDLTK